MSYVITRFDRERTTAKWRSPSNRSIPSSSARSPASISASRSAARTPRRSTRAWTAMLCWSFMARTSPTSSRSPSRALRPLEAEGPARHHPQGVGEPAGRGHGRSLQPRQGRQDHLGRRPPVVLQAGRPAVALRQLLCRGPGQVLGPVRPHHPVVGRRTEFADMRAAYDALDDAHQGRGRGPHLRAFANPFARRDRLRRVHARGDRALPAGAPAPRAHPSGRPQVAVPVDATPARSRVGRSPRRARSCATSPSTRRSASSSIRTHGGSTTW